MRLLQLTSVWPREFHRFPGSWGVCPALLWIECFPPPLPDRKKKPGLFVQLTDFHANAQIYGWRLNVNTAFSRYRITVPSCCFAFRTNGKLFTFSDAFSSTVRQNNRMVKWRKWGRNYKMTVWGIRELVSYRATADRKSSVSPTDLITCLFEWRALHSNQVTGTPTHTSWLVAAVYVLCLSVSRFRYFNPLSHTDAHGDSQCTCMHAFKPDQVTTDGEVGNRCRQADPGLSGHNIITGPAVFFFYARTTSPFIPVHLDWLLQLAWELETSPKHLTH